MSSNLCILEEKFPTAVIKAHCVPAGCVIGEGESRERRQTAPLQVRGVADAGSLMSYGRPVIDNFCA